MTTRKPHKHAEFIKAWADGAEIQVYDGALDRWVDVIGNPAWTSERYRIKPEPKPDQVVFPATAGYRGENGYAHTVSVKDQLKLTFDGETGKLKSAEVLRCLTF